MIGKGEWDSGVGVGSRMDTWMVGSLFGWEEDLMKENCRSWAGWGRRCAWRVVYQCGFMRPYKISGSIQIYIHING